MVREIGENLHPPSTVSQLTSCCVLKSTRRPVFKKYAPERAPVALKPAKKKNSMSQFNENRGYDENGTKKKSRTPTRSTFLLISSVGNSPHVPPIDVVGNNVWIDVFQPGGNGSVLAFVGHGELHEMLETFVLGGVAEVVVSKSVGFFEMVVGVDVVIVVLPDFETIQEFLCGVVEFGVFDGPSMEERPCFMNDVLGCG